MNNRIFFQHPDLMRMLRVHEDVMTMLAQRFSISYLAVFRMMNVLTTQQSAADNVDIVDEGGAGSSVKASTPTITVCERTAHLGCF